MLSNSAVLQIEDVAGAGRAARDEGDLMQHLRKDERDYIIATLRAHGLRMTESANALGISRKTLWQKMKKYNIDRDTI